MIEALIGAGAVALVGIFGFVMGWRISVTHHIHPHVHPTETFSDGDHNGHEEPVSRGKHAHRVVVGRERVL